MSTHNKSLTGNGCTVKTTDKALVGLNGLGGHPNALGVVSLGEHLVELVHDLDHLLVLVNQMME